MPTQNIKLTALQKDVLRSMRAGTDYYFNPITSYHPYTKGRFGSTAAMVHGKIMISLETFGLIEKQRTDRVVYKYVLTEAGKTISLN